MIYANDNGMLISFHMYKFLAYSNGPVIKGIYMGLYVGAAEADLNFNPKRRRRRKRRRKFLYTALPRESFNNNNTNYAAGEVPLFDGSAPHPPLNGVYICKKWQSLVAHETSNDRSLL